MIIDSSGTIVCLESSSYPWTFETLTAKLRLCLADKAPDSLADLQNAVKLIALRRGEFFIPGFVDTHTRPSLPILVIIILTHFVN